MQPDHLPSLGPGRNTIETKFAVHDITFHAIGLNSRRRSATKGQMLQCNDGTIYEAMTLQEAKSIARHLGLTLRKVRSGDYRVNFRDGNETTPYYTDSLEDAVNTAVEMARKRGLVE